jgi:hypothetical protein
MKTSMKPTIVFNLFRESPRLAEAKSDAKILEADPTSLRDHARHYIYVLCDKTVASPFMLAVRGVHGNEIGSVSCAPASSLMTSLPVNAKIRFSFK